MEGYDWRTPSTSEFWRVSQTTREFLTTSADEFVMPGAGSYPFGCVPLGHRKGHQPRPIPDETTEPDSTGDAFRRRCGASNGGAFARQLFLEPSDTTDKFGVVLRLEPVVAVLNPGDLALLKATLTNFGDTAIELPKAFDIESRGLVLSMTSPGSTTRKRYFPPVVVDAFKQSRRLESGSEISTFIKVFYGAEGWTLLQPGSYRFQASMQIEAEEQVVRLASADAQIVVRANEPSAASPCASLVKAAQRRLPDKVLSTEAGLSLYLGGAPHLHVNNELLEGVAAGRGACTQQQGASFSLALADLKTAVRFPSTSVRHRQGNRAWANDSLLPSEFISSEAGALCRQFTQTRSEQPPSICEPQTQDERPTERALSGQLAVFYFDKSSAVVREANLPQVQSLANMLLASPSQRVRVVGFADAAGAEATNLWVSEQRARSVRNLLIVQGIEGSRVAIEGRGERGAASESASSQLTQKDRRVTVFAI